MPDTYTVLEKPQIIDGQSLLVPVEFSIDGVAVKTVVSVSDPRSKQEFEEAVKNRYQTEKFRLEAGRRIASYLDTIEVNKPTAIA